MRERFNKLCLRRFCLKGSRVHLETDDLIFLVSRLFVRYDLVESTKQFHNGVDIVGQLRPSRNLISSISSENDRRTLRGQLCRIFDRHTEPA